MLIVAKKQFFYYYYKAYLDTLIEINICSGWRATGLWPLSKYKALRSRFIDNNRRDKARLLELSIINSFSSYFCTNKCFYWRPRDIFTTSKRSQDLHSMVA